jgi:4'-phosphopantetheinyl transferase
VTPASARHAAHVLYAPVSHDPDVSRHCASVLSETELRRADRFATEDDRVRFTQRRAFRRFCGATALGSLRSLPQIDFEETENGRPCLADLPDVWFSFSSCRFGLLGAWSWTHGIGVDLEVQTRNLEAVELAHRFFTETETIVVEGAEGLERQRTFVQFWSLKEAALKSIGEGLPFGLETFEFELEPDLRIVNAPCAHGGPERFDAYLLEGADVCAALVTRSMVCYDSDGEIPPWGVPQ